jgi:hypothetical protein
MPNAMSDTNGVRANNNDDVTRLSLAPDVLPLKVYPVRDALS